MKGVGRNFYYLNYNGVNIDLKKEESFYIFYDLFLSKIRKEFFIFDVDYVFFISNFLKVLEMGLNIYLEFFISFSKKSKKRFFFFKEVIREFIIEKIIEAVQTVERANLNIEFGDIFGKLVKNTNTNSVNKNWFFNYNIMLEMTDNKK